MSGKVSSDLSSAHAAVSQFSKGEYSSQQFSLGESNIVGMKNAVQLSNSIIGDLAQLETSIQNQVDKFPKLASVIEARDKQDAVDLSGMSLGF